VSHPKHQTRAQCRRLACRFRKAISQLHDSGLPQLASSDETLYAWREEIAAIWRFTRNKGINEGFNTVMELIKRQAFGFATSKTTACASKSYVIH
jgi:transposase